MSAPTTTLSVLRARETALRSHIDWLKNIQDDLSLHVQNLDVLKIAASLFRARPPPARDTDTTDEENEEEGRQERPWATWDENVERVEGLLSTATRQVSTLHDPLQQSLGELALDLVARSIAGGSQSRTTPETNSATATTTAATSSSALNPDTQRGIAETVSDIRTRLTLLESQLSIRIARAQRDV